MKASITLFCRWLCRDFLPVALLSFLPVLSAQQVTGKPQQLSSPDQTPEGLSMS